MLRASLYQLARSGRVTWTGVLFVLVCIFGAVFFINARESAYQNRTALRDELSLINESRRLELAEDEYMVGDSDSRIVVIEYSDLECPFCKAFNAHRPALEELYKNRSVGFVFRHFPLSQLHERAKNEAIALECAGMLGDDKAFFAYRDLVYAHTKSNDTLDPTLLGVFADKLGLSIEEFSICLSSTEAARKVGEDIQSGTRLGIYSTPSFAFFKDGEFQFVLISGSTIGWKNLEMALNALTNDVFFR